MSSRPIRTGLARPGPARLREKVSYFPQVARTAADAPAVEARELWLGVHLPWLSLEALSEGEASKAQVELPDAALPQAVVELQGQTQYVVAADERAQQFGVRAGMGMAAAFALIPALNTLTRDPVREKQLLERLAARAHRFTTRSIGSYEQFG